MRRRYCGIGPVSKISLDFFFLANLDLAGCFLEFVLPQLASNSSYLSPAIPVRHGGGLVGRFQNSAGQGNGNGVPDHWLLGESAQEHVVHVHRGNTEKPWRTALRRHARVATAPRGVPNMRRAPPRATQRRQEAGVLQRGPI